MPSGKVMMMIRNPIKIQILQIDLLHLVLVLLRPMPSVRLTVHIPIHIRRWTSGHTEAIVTRDTAAAQRFVSLMDSTAVMVNASTRFTDGGQFGFGAEIGISTQKLHARGPMGLSELTSTTYVVTGDGHVRG